MGTSPNDATRVDLGEDLLVAGGGIGSRGLFGGVGDELDSARILINEGLLPEARSAIFRALRKDGANRIAARLLEEVRELEIRALLEAPREGIDHRRKEPSAEEPVDAELALAGLERDWKIGVLPGEADLDSLRSWLGPLKLASRPAQERKDWAVALIQAEAPELAAELLESSSIDQVEHWCLRASACVLARRFEEACAICEQGLRDPAFPEALRQELSYLRARALLGLGSRTEALEILQSLGSYRDSELLVTQTAAPVREPAR
jgi:hypothetical protein